MLPLPLLILLPSAVHTVSKGGDWLSIWLRDVSGDSHLPKLTSSNSIKEEAKSVWQVSKRQEETTEMVPLWWGTLLVTSCFKCPSWHPKGKEISSDLLFPKEEQGFVAIRKSEAALFQKGRLLEGSRESLAHSHQDLWDYCWMGNISSAPPLHAKRLP